MLCGLPPCRKAKRRTQFGRRRSGVGSDRAVARSSASTECARERHSRSRLLPPENKVWVDSLKREVKVRFSCHVCGCVGHAEKDTQLECKRTLRACHRGADTSSAKPVLAALLQFNSR